MEPSPFPEDDGTTSAGAPRPWLPAKPLSQGELDYYQGLPWELRTFNPWACMFNRNSEDGIGYYSGAKRIQCEVLLADPTKSRYCLDHAKQMGVDFYAPPELAEAVAKETATNLTRLVPKATRVLEIVMDDDQSGVGDPLEEAGVDIGGDDLPASATTCQQEAHNAAVPRADLEEPPATRQAHPVEQLLRFSIEQLLQKVKPSLLSTQLVRREHVRRRRVHPSPPIPRDPDLTTACAHGLHASRAGSRARARSESVNDHTTHRSKRVHGVSPETTHRIRFRRVAARHR